MSIRLRKALTAAGLILVTILGGVALSLAHEEIPSEPAHAWVIWHGDGHGLSHPGAALEPRLEWDACDPPTVLPFAVQTSRPLNLSHYAAADALIESSPGAPKVSLYMLDSVLLI